MRRGGTPAAAERRARATPPMTSQCRPRIGMPVAVAPRFAARPAETKMATPERNRAHLSRRRQHGAVRSTCVGKAVPVSSFSAVLRPAISRNRSVAALQSHWGIRIPLKADAPRSAHRFGEESGQSHAVRHRARAPSGGAICRDDGCTKRASVTRARAATLSTAICDGEPSTSPECLHRTMRERKAPALQWSPSNGQRG